MEKHLDKKEEKKSFIKIKRQEIDEGTVLESSKNIVNKLLQHKEFTKSSKLWLFSALVWELDLSEIIYSNKDKQYYFPKVVDGNLEFRKVTSAKDLELWGFWILEPNKECELIDIWELDLVLIPWLAFTKIWKRIWFGKGFYDKALKGTDIYKMWICFEYQVFGDFEEDEWDIRMDEILCW